MDDIGAGQTQAPSSGDRVEGTVAASEQEATPELPVPPPPRASGPRLDVSAVPPQGGHVARRCPLRVQYEWFPPEGVEPERPADVERLRAEAAAELDADVLAEVQALHADAVVVDPDRAVGRQVAETLLAMGRGVPVVVGGRLPVDVLGRRMGRPDVLVRGERRSDGPWTYHPVLVRNHRTLDSGPPRDPERGALVSSLGAPWIAGTEPSTDRTARTHQVDLMALAHLHRILEATPHASSAAVGAVIGTEREVVWHRLDVAVTQHRWDRRQPTSESTLARHDLELSFRLDVLAAAASGSPMVGSVAVGECATCTWRRHCGPRIEGADSTSLLPGFGYRQWYNLARAGITTRTQVAALDLRTALVRDALHGIEGPGGPVDLAELVRAAGSVDRTEPVAVVASIAAGETDVDRLVDVLGDHHIVTAGDLTALDPTVVSLADQPVRRLAEAVQGARAQATGRPQLRHGVSGLVVPSADVEVDIDMESGLDGSAYLWGAWADGTYRAVTSWEPPSPEREAQVFADFWAWLTELRQEAADQDRTVATYCWFKGAESGALRRGAKAAASVLGHLDAPAEVEELLAGDQFVDLYEMFTTQLVTGGSAGLKVVASLAGFAWRDTDPNGADSMAWHAQAVADPDPERRTEARHRLLAYNEDDVRATAAVRTWLRNDLGAVAGHPGLTRRVPSGLTAPPRAAAAAGPSADQGRSQGRRDLAASSVTADTGVPMTLNALVDIIRHNVAERPDAPAVTYAGSTQSFAELDRRSSQVANALIAAGVRPQDRVAYLDKNVPAYFEVAFGALKANAVLVGVNWRLAAPEVAHILEDAGAKVLFVGGELADTVAGVIDRLPALELVVANDGDRFEPLDGWIGGQLDTDPQVPTTASDVATQLYTSGTTGHPKGVMLSNDNLATIINNVAAQWRMEPGSVSLAAMPMFHIGGSGWAFVSMAFGAEVVLMRDIDPQALLDLIGAHHITHAFLVPAVLQFMLVMPNLATADVSSLELVVYGASPITETTLTASIQALGCEFMQVYGLTETSGAITQLDPDAHRPDLLRSCGAAYPWVELRCVDAAGEPVPTGTVGEIWTRSGQNMLGYWNKPEATAEAVTSDGWFKTGDAGYLDADGHLFIHDRVKDMIVSGGENIYPAEIENVLAQHPSVAEVGVIGVPDEKWGETVKAIVVARPGTTVDEADLLAFARERLAGFKLPRSVDVIDELPRNPTGKILKKDLRAPYWEGRDRQVG